MLSNSSGSCQSPISNAQNMKISLCRINDALLENYLNAQDSCSTSLDVRYHLLLLELDERDDLSELIEDFDDSGLVNTIIQRINIICKCSESVLTLNFHIVIDKCAWCGKGQRWL